MFRHSDPAALMDEAEQAQLAELDDTVTVYRGVTTINSDNLLALSWTLDYETADWFARRFDEDGTVYKEQIAKEHIEKPSDVLKVGQEVTAKVVDFKKDDRKISLSIKALDNE